MLVAANAWPGATELARSVRSGEISPVETVRAALDAIDRLDPTLHAFTAIAADDALAAARGLEARIAAGEPAGPLAGVPVAIKDLVLTRGLRTTFGSRLYADFIPDADDVAVERLRAAGAIVIGKTNAAEFGYGGIGHNRLFPTTRNPWSPEHTSGGSSAGSAAAVAAGIVPLALGSDGGGSVRLPAAFCGIVGIKPTMGRIPLWPGSRDADHPGASGWESVEHLGPLARSVADAAAMIAAMAGPDPRDRLSVPDEGVRWREAAEPRQHLGLRVAYIPVWGGLRPEPEIRALIDAAVTRFATDLRCSIDEIDAPVPDVTPAYRAIVALETDLTGLRRMSAGREDDLTPGLRRVLETRWTAEEFADAITERKRVNAAMAALMARYDLVLSPTVGCPAFGLDRDGPGTIAGVPVADDAWTPCLFVANLTGQPAASVPAGFTADGRPAGLHIMGRRYADETVIAAAAAFEAVAPWAGRRPPVAA
jgi:aspartyl-tRNA(Asn)/glutamyl-tRNA(Gln) amidotransferase subunit A